MQSKVSQGPTFNPQKHHHRLFNKKNSKAFFFLHESFVYTFSERKKFSSCSVLRGEKRFFKNIAKQCKTINSITSKISFYIVNASGNFSSTRFSRQKSCCALFVMFEKNCPRDYSKGLWIDMSSLDSQGFSEKQSFYASPSRTKIMWSHV